MKPADENEMIETIISRIIDELEEIADDVGAEPMHVLLAVTALSVRLCHALAKDKGDVRGIISELVDDYATQAANGAPMVTQ